MSKHLAVATLALCVAALAAAPAMPARPPDGTYTYTISNVPSLTQTTVVIRSSGTSFSVIENPALAGFVVSTQTDYDSRTLLPTHYRGSENGTTADISFSNGNAQLLEPATGRSKLPNTIGLTASDGLFSALVMLPSILAATGGQPLSDLAINGFKVVEVTPTTAADPRPAGVPPSDVETAVDIAGQREAFWSNPSTHVVDRIDIGAAFGVLSNYTTSTMASTPAPAPAQPTPYPTSTPHFTSRDVSFPSGGATISGTLTIPDGNKGRPMPAFVFIHGSGAGTRDGGVPANPTFLDLSNALSNHGVVVLRYDKRGIGLSTGTATEDWHVLGNDARAAFAFLAHQPSVDPNRIFILGHSEGGEIAPLIAPSIPHLAGIVLLAGPAVPMERVINEQLPGDANTAERDVILRGLSSYVGIDPAKVIAKVTVPILALQGGRDINVRVRDLPHLVDAARAAHRNITVKVLPQDDHLFLRLAPNQPNDHSEYAVPAPLDPRVAQTILRWIGTLTTNARADGS